MEELGNAMYLDSVPEIWAKRAYQSLYGMAQWFADLIQRIKVSSDIVLEFMYINVMKKVL